MDKWRTQYRSRRAECSGQCPSLGNLSFGERLWTVSTACLGRSIRDKDLFSSVENELHILTLRAC